MYELAVFCFYHLEWRYRYEVDIKVGLYYKNDIWTYELHWAGVGSIVKVCDGEEVPYEQNFMSGEPFVLDCSMEQAEKYDI